MKAFVVFNIFGQMDIEYQYNVGKLSSDQCQRMLHGYKKRLTDVIPHQITSIYVLYLYFIQKYIFFFQNSK